MPVSPYGNQEVGHPTRGTLSPLHNGATSSDSVSPWCQLRGGADVLKTYSHLVDLSMKDCLTVIVRTRFVAHRTFPACCA